MKLPRDPDQLITIDMNKAQVHLFAFSLIAIIAGFLIAGFSFIPILQLKLL